MTECFVYLFTRTRSFATKQNTLTHSHTYNTCIILVYTIIAYTIDRVVLNTIHRFIQQTSHNTCMRYQLCTNPQPNAYTCMSLFVLLRFYLLHSNPSSTNSNSRSKSSSNSRTYTDITFYSVNTFQFVLGFRMVTIPLLFNYSIFFCVQHFIHCHCASHKLFRKRVKKIK